MSTPSPAVARLRPHPLRAVAEQEFLVMLRTRWVGGFGLLFLCLVSGFAWFGTADLGIAGIQDFSRTSATLVNLVCAVAPLMALLVGLHGFTIERGAEDLLLSQPVRRTTILLGKGLGLYLTLVLSTLLGFGVAGAIISYRVGPEGIGDYALFVGLSLVLELCFLSISLLLAGFAGQRMRALGAGLAAWLFFVLLYDLLVIGSTLLLKGRTLQSVLFVSVFFNPVDMVRVSQLIVLNGETFFGPVGAAWVRFCGGPLSLVALVSGAIVLWVVVPAAIGLRAFSHRDF
jgi:Cu-processing system permease protein